MNENILSVIDSLERVPHIVIPMVREIPAALLKRRPNANKWSAHEHACHISVVNGLFFPRLEIMLNETSPVIVPYDPKISDPDDALLKLDLEESLIKFQHDRSKLVAHLRNLSINDWSKTASHEEYNSYSVFIMFRHLVLHDFFHVYRIEDLLLRKNWE
jgi:hypothetical protein